MKPVREVPPVQPDKAVAEVLRTIGISMLGKRYRLNFKVSAEEPSGDTSKPANEGHLKTGQ